MHAARASAVPSFLVVALLAVGGGGAGCTLPDDGGSPFRAGSDAAALDVVRGVLEAAQAKDERELLARLCDKSPAEQARLAAALGGHVDGYEIVRVEPAWVGAEPYFRVDVSLQHGGQTEERSLSVRVRDGCVDRLLGEPVEQARPPGPGEIAL